jgi:hypothetical protein
LKNRLKKLNKLIQRAVSYKYFIEEMALFIGVFLFIITNFLINFYFGMYSLSFLLIAFSIFSFKFSRK